MINLRSPYFVIKQEANLTQVDISIYIHTGTQSATVSGAQYTLTGTAITPATGNPYVVFDISELARDYIDSTFNGTYSCTAVWVNYQTTRYLSGAAQTPDAVVQLAGFDGYHYFEDGEQSSTTTYTAPDLLQSNTLVYKNDDDLVTIPVLQDNNPTITFLWKGEVTNTQTITSTTTSTDIIRYINNEGASQDSYRARVLADSGTYEAEALGNVFERYSTMPCDTIVLNVGGTLTKISVTDIPECKYTPYKLTFVNKFGALQDVWFFKSSQVSMSATKEQFKRNTVSIGSYDTSKHSKKVFHKMGSERMVLNSGFYPESYNEVFRQLMLAEDVWIDYDNQTLPVNITTSDVTFKTSVNDKLIEYQVELEFAFDKISNVR